MRDDDRDPAIVAAERLAEYVLDAPQVQGILGQIQDGIGQFQGLLDKLGYVIEQAPQRQQRPARAPRPRSSSSQRSAPRPPPVHPLEREEQNARQILGFSPRETLTKAQITKRRRQLAATAHPDKGGSQETMQRVNAAADFLLQLYSK